MYVLKLSIYAALLFFTSFALEGYEWRCPLPRAKYYGNWQTETITAKGFVELEGTQVTKSLCVHGSLDAEDAQIASAYVEGRAHFDKSSIDGNIKIVGRGYFKNSKVAGITYACGPLEALCTAFCFGIQTSASYIELKNSTTPYIYFFPCRQDIQIVKLMQGTVVEGDIEFACGQGRVFIDSTSTLKGLVRGGFIAGTCY